MSGIMLSSNKSTGEILVIKVCIQKKVSWVCWCGAGLFVYCFAKQLYLKYSGASDCLQTSSTQLSPRVLSHLFLFLTSKNWEYSTVSPASCFS